MATLRTIIYYLCTHNITSPDAVLMYKGSFIENALPQLVFLLYPCVILIFLLLHITKDTINDIIIAKDACCKVCVAMKD